MELVQDGNKLVPKGYFYTPDGKQREVRDDAHAELPKITFKDNLWWLEFQSTSVDREKYPTCREADIFRYAYESLSGLLDDLIINADES